MIPPTLVVDTETDCLASEVRKLHSDWPIEWDDEKVLAEAVKERVAEGKKDMLPLPLHHIVVIGCVLRTEHELRVFSLAPPMTESEMLTRFFDGIGRVRPTIITWNGSSYDLPVMQYRALVHGVSSSIYWEDGTKERDFQYNNYRNRYHRRHVDLMDVLSNHQGQSKARLDDLSKLCGFPGKLGMDGSEVARAVREGRVEEVRQYCETDVVNTYLLYIRWNLCRGLMTKEAYENELSFVHRVLVEKNCPPWPEYLSAWNYQPIVREDPKPVIQLTIDQAPVVEPSK